jgi:L-iditol 2-dehydrogenase
VGAARAHGARAQLGVARLMRAAVLHGPGDLRVEEVPDPEGEVVVEVRAATACGTDRKMLRHGHPTLGPYPCRFGHETAGVRLDTGDAVLVGDSVACGGCAPCLADRPQVCRAPAWVLGGFAQRIGAPAAALHAVPHGLDLRGAAMAEPLAACVHAVARGTDAEDAGVLGGGTIGLMLARLLVLDGRRVTLADRHAERRAQAEALGARGAEALGEHDLVFEAVGRPQAWRTALGAVRPGGTCVLVGGCPVGTEVTLPTGPLHYDELDVRGAFHHAPGEVDRALELLATGAVDWRALAGPEVGLDDLAAALTAPTAGAAVKPVVIPRAA